MILEVVKIVGELVSLSQELKTNKTFISALVRRRKGVILPVKLDLSLGMRRYQVLLTDDRGDHPKFWPDLGRFVLPKERPGEKLGDHVLRRNDPAVNLVDKGKKLVVAPDS